MLWESKDTTNPSPSKTTASKVWKSLGNGNETLSKTIPAKLVEESAEIASTKFEVEKIAVGDVVYWDDKWVVIEEIKDKMLVVKHAGNKVEAETSLCHKRISIRILICTPSVQSIYLIDVEGSTKLSRFAKKFTKRFFAKANKPEWYLNGKVVDNDSTIEGMHLKLNDKLACMLLGYEIKTFKRFPKVDDRGWYMSRTSKDSITFVPNKDIMVFGFGMFYTREGPSTYTIGYELFFNEDSKIKNTVTIAKPSPDDIIHSVYFYSDQTPTLASSGTKISICIHYDSYEEASRLRVGGDGRNYEKVEGNEEGLFVIESHHDSGNGTDVGSGQIPELYYAIKQ